MTAAPVDEDMEHIETITGLKKDMESMMGGFRNGSLSFYDTIKSKDGFQAL
jgi:hypothetical protein